MTDSIKDLSPNFPRVAVLMATHNGARWISEQIDSIVSQSDCHVEIYVSDDNSFDNTLSVVEGYASDYSVFLVDSSSAPFGSANRNFINLILNASVDAAEYIAFSDQDDVWNSDKLRRSIDVITAFNLDAYSSDVEAFWDDGRKFVVKKSWPQKRYDFLFESAGPGCTFVIKKSRFLELREWVVDNLNVLIRFPVHDWFIYAYARSHSWIWRIDNVPSMKYRQHALNEIGANVGLLAAKNRVTKFFKSNYLNHTLVIGDLTLTNSPVTRLLRRFSFVDLLKLLFNANHYRRARSDVWALRFLMLGYWVYKKTIKGKRNA